MKNTLENKEKLFAQYWGQTYEFVNTGAKFTVSERAFPFTVDGSRLILKSLSKITKKDLEAIEFKNIGDKKVSFYFDDYACSWRSSCGASGGLLLKHYDILRSRGYALPFMGISVEELVEWGWVKLK